MLFSCADKKSEQDSEEFSFVFMTDVHLQPELNASKGFYQAIDTLNKLNPDFVITGGDLIMDALEVSYERADSLYHMYKNHIEAINAPVYNTLGNHEIYGLWETSGADTSHPEFGEQMFEEKLGDSYYSFEHKGWKFMILNSVEGTYPDRYDGFIDQNQMSWIEEELANTTQEMPIVLSTHIPFITVFMQKYYGSTEAADSGLVIYNSKEVLDLFQNHNLKLVLQGHLHMVEDIYIEGVHFLTGGAVSANWWKGSYRNCEEGFMHITVTKDSFVWQYIDYEWEISN